MGKGKAQPKHNEKEKLDIGFRICELYESQWCTLESCCEAVGITSRSFYLWCIQLSELSERYKKAKDISEQSYFEELLKPKAMRSLQKLVEGFDDERTVLEDIVYQGVKVDGEKKEVLTKTKVAPNPTSVIFAMKGVFPGKFKDSLDHTTLGQPIAVADFSKLTTDELRALANIRKKATEKKDGET